MRRIEQMGWKAQAGCYTNAAGYEICLLEGDAPWFLYTPDGEELGCFYSPEEAAESLVA